MISKHFFIAFLCYAALIAASSPWTLMDVEVGRARTTYKNPQVPLENTPEALVALINPSEMVTKYQTTEGVSNKTEYLILNRVHFMTPRTEAAAQPTSGKKDKKAKASTAVAAPAPAVDYDNLSELYTDNIQTELNRLYEDITAAHFVKHLPFFLDNFSKRLYGIAIEGKTLDSPLLDKIKAFKLSFEKGKVQIYIYLDFDASEDKKLQARMNFDSQISSMFPYHNASLSEQTLKGWMTISERLEDIADEEMSSVLNQVTKAEALAAITSASSKPVKANKKNVKEPKPVVPTAVDPEASLRQKQAIDYLFSKNAQEDKTETETKPATDTSASKSSKKNKKASPAPAAKTVEVEEQVAQALVAEKDPEQERLEKEAAERERLRKEQEEAERLAKEAEARRQREKEAEERRIEAEAAAARREREREAEEKRLKKEAAEAKKRQKEEAERLKKEEEDRKKAEAAELKRKQEEEAAEAKRLQEQKRKEWEQERKFRKEQKQLEDLKKKQEAELKSKKEQAQPQSRGQRLATNAVKAVAAPAPIQQRSEAEMLKHEPKQKLNPKQKEARERKLNEEAVIKSMEEAERKKKDDEEKEYQRQLEIVRQRELELERERELALAMERQEEIQREQELQRQKFLEKQREQELREKGRKEKAHRNNKPKQPAQAQRSEDRKLSVEEFDVAQRLAQVEAEREAERARNAQLEARLRATEAEARRYREQALAAQSMPPKYVGSSLHSSPSSMDSSSSHDFNSPQAINSRLNAPPGFSSPSNALPIASGLDEHLYASSTYGQQRVSRQLPASNLGQNMMYGPNPNYARVPPQYQPQQPAYHHYQHQQYPPQELSVDTDFSRMNLGNSHDSRGSHNSAFWSSPNSGSMHSNGGFSAPHDGNLFSPAQGSVFSQNSGSLGFGLHDNFFNDILDTQSQPSFFTQPPQQVEQSPSVISNPFQIVYPLDNAPQQTLDTSAFAGLFAGPSSTSPLGQLMQQPATQNESNTNEEQKYYTNF